MPDGMSPAYGVYLGAREPGPFEWPYEWIVWRDFRLPVDKRRAVAVLVEAYERAAAERVEVACGGGIGRTGTALAVMAVAAGIAPCDAVGWVREQYHRRAVETPWQKRWVSNLRLDQQ